MTNLHDLINNVLEQLSDFDINAITDIKAEVESGEPTTDPNTTRVFESFIDEHNGYLYAVMTIAAEAGILDEFPFEKADDELFDLWGQYCRLNGVENRFTKNEVYGWFNRPHT